MSINLSRNTRLWISTEPVGGTHNTANTFEIPVQEGYSFSQSVSTTDISVEEAGASPIRGGKRFNTALDPVEWSIVTYMNPYFATNHYMVDMLLWHALASSNSSAVDLDDSTTSSKVYGDPTSFLVTFADNSAHVLTELYLYFKVDGTMYYIDKAQVGQAEISIDISDIAQTSWSGQGLSYTKIAEPAFVAGGSGVFNEASPEAGKYVAISAGKKYLVNKLTLLDMTSSAAPDANNNYTIPVTSASITINNNVTYLTPNTLAEVDQAIGSFTGAFEVTGSIEAYLRANAGATGAPGFEYGTSDLLDHMLTKIDEVTNSSDMTFKIGGATGPRAEINIPTAQLSVPSLSIDDVVSTTIEFKGIPTSSDLLSGDEVSLEFFAS